MGSYKNSCLYFRYFFDELYIYLSYLINICIAIFIESIKNHFDLDIVMALKGLGFVDKTFKS